MLTPPEGVADAEVLDAVDAHWLPGAVSAVHLAVGFGAHHWKVCDGTGRTLFVTLDELEAPGERHSARSLEGAYAGAAALASAGVTGVWPSLPARSGRFTVPFAGGALSATGWLEGRTPGQEESAEAHHAGRVVAVLGALHRRPPPPGIRRWKPRVDAGFPEWLRERSARPWTARPLGEHARRAIVEQFAAIDRWTRRYLALAAEADRDRDAWVATHGEPHHANQVVTPDGLVLVDWESLALAPRERDLVDLVDIGAVTARAVDAREAMLELFRLDWRLSEIVEYTAWFRRPHQGSADDHTALEGLREELRSGVVEDREP